MANTRTLYFLLLFTTGLLLTTCKHEPTASGLGIHVKKTLKVADSLNKNGLHKKALDYVNAGFRKLEKPSEVELLAKFNANHYYYSEDQQNYSLANNYADSAMALFENAEFRKSNLEDYKKWLFNKGDALINLKKFQEAFSYYHLGKLMIEELGDTCAMASFSSRLGKVRYLQLNYTDAIRYYRQAFREHNLCKPDNASDYYAVVTEPQGCLNGIAWFYELLNETDSALVYYQKALTFLELRSKNFPANRRDQEIGKAVIYGNMGGLYSKLDSDAQAEKLLKASIGINRKTTYDQRDLQSAQIKLANLYIKTGKLDEAARLLTDARNGLDTLPNANYRERWMKAMWMYNDKAGNLKQAYYWLQNYKQLSDSLTLINQTLMNADFVREFENMDHSLSMGQLKTKNRQNFILLVISILALLSACFIVYLIYKNWQFSKKNVQGLKMLNDQISQKNEKLQLALLALQDSQQDNTRLMAMVAHDLRTPAANIQMGTGILLKSSDISDKDRQFVEIIRKSAIRSLEMIDEVMHSNETAPHTSSDLMDLDAMINDCVELLQLRANEKQQQILVHSEPLLFKGSREKMWRVISNLIFNAIKFTPRNGTIHVSLVREGQEAVIAVKDDGIGIPHEDQAKLFDIEKVPGRKGTEGESSNGLGLAIAKQIVSSYQGKIYFENNPDKGTTFFVHLPAQMNN